MSALRWRSLPHSWQLRGSQRYRLAWTRQAFSAILLVMFNFDQIIDRKNTNSLKWEEEKGSLPLWVADMDFEVAPCIQKAVKERANHPVFGYSIIPDEWAESYISWWKNRHNLKIQKEELVFCTGVVPAISSIVRKLTTPAEYVLLQTPVYNIFFNSVVNNGRNVLESPLDYDGEKYTINFERLEKDLSNPQVSMMILCNPHNPCGNLWSKKELAKIGSLCKKYNVLVISDEIHCDITRPETEYTPFALSGDDCRMNSVTCIAPSKAFNIAGLNSAAVYIPNPNLRHKVWRALNTDECAEPNAFAIQATVAAFSEGEGWLNEMREYVFENRKIAENFIAQKLPGLKPVKSDSTYLLWLDVSKTGLSGDDFAQKLKEKTGLFISGGSQYGEAGKSFVRINLACPKSVLEEALERLLNFLL